MAAGRWGYVTDANTGEPLSEAHVAWICGAYGFHKRTLSNEQGYYDLTDPEDRDHAGHCEELHCEKEGYLSMEAHPIWNGEYTRSDWQMTPSG